MKNNKVLMSHPNKLIFYMCIAEAICAWQAIIAHIGTADFICYLGLDVLFSKTLFGRMTPEESVAYLEESNFNILSLAEFFSLALNFFMCLDIILTLRNPFYPHERRMNKYLFGSVIIAFTAFFTTLGRYNEPIFTKSISTQAQAIISCTIMSFYIFFSISSVAYAWRINTRPGMSTEVRQSFIVRHRNYVATYLITWLPYYGFSFYILFISSVFSPNIMYSEIYAMPEFTKSIVNWLAAWNYSCMLTGLLMSIVRVREPVFWSFVRSGIYQFFGELPPDKDSKGAKMDGTLLSFLMSSLNIELVHIILTTVSKNTVGTPKTKNNYMVYQNYDHTNKNTFVLDSIEIEDKKNWDINMVETTNTFEDLARRRSTLDNKDTEKLVINEDIEVTEYAPDVFAFLRLKDGYDNSVLLESLDPERNRSMVFKAGESQGKSGVSSSSLRIRDSLSRR
jgi:hypothetical protein